MARAGGGVSITGIGFPELERKLKELAPKVQKKVVRSAMRRVAKDIVLPAARSGAPVRSGVLKASLAVKAMKARKRAVFGVQVQTREGWFKGEAYYGAFVELGTRTMKAKPYLRPALNENRGRITSELGSEIGAGIETVAKE